jgi:hypothetical protein
VSERCVAWSDASFEIVTERITGIADSSSSSPLSLSLASLSLDIDYLVLVPSIEASPHARPLLTPALLSHADLGPMGALPGPPPDAHPAHMPARAGSDPRTPTRGLFWAGNAGAAGANTTMAAAQGQLAGVVAAGEVAAEDLESELGAVQG